MVDSPAAMPKSSLFDVVPSVFEIAIQREQSFDERPSEFVEQRAFVSQFDPGTRLSNSLRFAVALERLTLKGYGRLRQVQSIRGL
jgi:hypothetical protein